MWVCNHKPWPKTQEMIFPIHLFRWAGSLWIAQRCRPLGVYKRGCNRYVRANQAYHQDHHPDRTFHALSPVRVPWERRPSRECAALYRPTLVSPAKSLACNRGYIGSGGSLQLAAYRFRNLQLEIEVLVADFNAGRRNRRSNQSRTGRGPFA